MNPTSHRMAAGFVFSVTRPGGLQSSELRLKTVSDPPDRILRVSDSARGEARRQPHISHDGRYVVFRYIPPESRGPAGGGYGPQQLRLLDLDTDEESELTKTTNGVVLANGWSGGWEVRGGSPGATTVAGRGEGNGHRTVAGRRRAERREPDEGRHGFRWSALSAGTVSQRAMDRVPSRNPYRRAPNRHHWIERWTLERTPGRAQLAVPRRRRGGREGQTTLVGRWPPVVLTCQRSAD